MPNKRRKTQATKFFNTYKEVLRFLSTIEEDTTKQNGFEATLTRSSVGGFIVEIIY